MHHVKKLLLLLSVGLALIIPLVGCDTLHGAGQDFQEFSQSLSAAANPD